MTLITRLVYGTEILSEKITGDADMKDVASKNYVDKLQLLRGVFACCLGLQFTDKDWLTKNFQFMKQHQFHTDYGQKQSALAKERNLGTNLNMLKQLHEQNHNR